MRDKILGIAVGQFTQYGVRAVTMEDIARLAGISKKTIYQEFRDKKELVKEAFSTILEQDRERMAFISETENGVIEHLLETSKMIRKRLAHINPMVIMEVQRYFPEAWGLFEEFREEVIMANLIRILDQGKKSGYFRPEIDTHILARLRVNQINSAFDPTNFLNAEYSLVELQVELLDHFLHGIFTEKGRVEYLRRKEEVQ